MVDLIFSYIQVQTLIQANFNDSFNSIIQKYINKTKLDVNNIYFVSNGQKIKKNKKVENIMNNAKKKSKRKMILVLSINSTINNDNANIINSKKFICPTCKEICIYEIKYLKIKL